MCVCDFLILYVSICIMCVYNDILYVWYTCFMYVWIYTNTYVSYCTYIYMYICICIYIYIYHVGILTMSPRCQCGWLVGGYYSYLSFVKLSQRYGSACLPHGTSKWWCIFTHSCNHPTWMRIQSAGSTQQQEVLRSMGQPAISLIKVIEDRICGILQKSTQNFHHETSQLKQRI